MTNPAVRSFSQRSPQILGILSARNLRRELCPRAKWRRRRCWQTTLFRSKSLILLNAEFGWFRIPRRDPNCRNESIRERNSASIPHLSSRQWSRSSCHPIRSRGAVPVGNWIATGDETRRTFPAFITDASIDNTTGSAVDPQVLSSAGSVLHGLAVGVFVPSENCSKAVTACAAYMTDGPAPM